MDRDGTRANATAARENASEGVEEVTPGKRGAGWRVAGDRMEIESEDGTGDGTHGNATAMTCTPVMASRAEGEKRGRASSDEDRADVTVRRMRNATWASGRAGKRKRRGKGSTQRRRDQRAHGRSGSSSEQSGSESDEGQSGADGAEEAPCQRIECRLVRTQHAALEQQVEELAERKEDAGREIEELEKKLEEGKQNAERMFEVREMIEWADGIGEENEFSVSGRERVREQWAGWERELGARRLRGERGRCYMPGEERVLWRHAVEICKGLVAAAEEARGQVADWNQLRQEKVECGAEVDSLREERASLREGLRETYARMREEAWSHCKEEAEKLQQDYSQRQQLLSSEWERRKQELAVGWEQLQVEFGERRTVQALETLAGTGEVEWFGGEEQEMLDRIAMSDEGLKKVELGDGMVLYDYNSGDKVGAVAARNARDDKERRRMEVLLTECRGLVLQSGMGEVISRPVQRFYRVNELNSRGAELAIAGVVTEKLDGQMLCGVVVQGHVELWSRSGWTELGRAATRVGVEHPGLLSLIEEVWDRGGSATFEYIGRQSRVKVRYDSTDFVLVAVRDRRTGRWWEYHELQCLTGQHEIRLVRRLEGLEGKTVREVQLEVKHWQDREGVVVWLDGGRMCKVKSDWWLRRGTKPRLRWIRGRQAREREDRRDAKKQGYMETKGQRVVLRGWDTGVSPVGALRVYPTAAKVEALYRRGDGKQGTVVLSFRSKEAAMAVRGQQQVEGKMVWAEQAYSGRCRSDRHRWVRTWWREEEGLDELREEEMIREEEELRGDEEERAGRQRS